MQCSLTQSLPLDTATGVRRLARFTMVGALAIGAIFSPSGRRLPVHGMGPALSLIGQSLREFSLPLQDAGVVPAVAAAGALVGALVLVKAARRARFAA